MGVGVTTGLVCIDDYTFIVGKSKAPNHKMVKIGQWERDHGPVPREAGEPDQDHVAALVPT